VVAPKRPAPVKAGQAHGSDERNRRSFSLARGSSTLAGGSPVSTVGVRLVSRATILNQGGDAPDHQPRSSQEALPAALTTCTQRRGFSRRAYVQALEAVDGEEATLTVIPPSGYVTPAPQVLSLLLSDMLDVQVDLETVP
jgi:hypothetical protein